MKQQFTSLEVIEFLFGPIFPGADLPTTTISIFKRSDACEGYWGRLGIVKDAIGYIHSATPIDTSMIRGTITGISANFNKVGPLELDGPCPERIQMLSTW